MWHVLLDWQRVPSIREGEGEGEGEGEEVMTYVLHFRRVQIEGDKTCKERSVEGTLHSGVGECKTDGDAFVGSV